jgi:5-methylcytosine-specific restriction endonuclease McrA
MSILVLNADFQPLNVTTFKRGYNLVYKGKAEIIKYDSEAGPIKYSQGKTMGRPLIIRLLRYITVPFKRVPLTKYNVYRRDGHQCAYCGSKENLTLDHVIPKSRGGKSSWDNLATCCFKCNNKKGDKTPSEAGMILKTKLYQPTFQQFINGMVNSGEKKWKIFDD